MATILKRFWSDECGSVPVEYGVIVLLIAASLIGVWTQLGESMVELYETQLGERLAAAIDQASAN